MKKINKNVMPVVKPVSYILHSSISISPRSNVIKCNPIQIEPIINFYLNMMSQMKLEMKSILFEKLCDK